MNTSIRGATLDRPDFLLQSSTFVTGVFIDVNVIFESNVVLLISENLEKLDGGGSNIVTERILLNDVEIHQEDLSIINAKFDVVSTGPQPLLFNISPGQINFTIQYKRTGPGRVNVSNIDINIIQLLSSRLNLIRGNITEADYSYSNTAFDGVFNFTIPKTIISKTYIVSKRMVTSTAQSTVDYFFRDPLGIDSPFSQRFQEDATDIGSVVTGFVGTVENGTHDHEVRERTTAGIITITSNILDLDLSDNSSNNISSFQASNPSTNLTNTLSFGPGTHNINNATIEVLNGSSVFLSSIVSLGSSSGKHFVNMFVNSTNSSLTCKKTKGRTIQGNTDSANPYIFTICGGIPAINNNYTFDTYIVVESGETAILLDESFSGFEITILDVNQTLIEIEELIPTLSTDLDVYVLGCEDDATIIFNFSNVPDNENVSLFLENITNIPIVESEGFNSSDLTFTEHVRYFLFPNIEVDNPILVTSGNISTFTLTETRTGEFTYFWNTSILGTESNRISIRVKGQSHLAKGKCLIDHYFRKFFTVMLSLFILKLVITLMLARAFHSGGDGNDSMRGLMG